MAMIDKSQEKVAWNRIYWLDNLRTFMIFLVVLYHAGLVYETSGFVGLFWIIDDPDTNSLVDIPNLMIIDIFVMAVIFFISGYLTPSSLKTKTGWAFLKAKFKRLMLPWILAVLTLMPLYKVIFLYSRNLPQESWTTYFHWSNGIWSQNWLWFLPVLFLFNVLFLFFSKIKIRLPHISVKTATGVIFVCCLIYSFCMDFFIREGWTKTILIDFQNERLLIYFMIFLLGSLCFKLRLFASGSGSKKLYFFILGTAWIPVIVYRYFYIQSFTFLGDYIFSEMIDTLLLWLSFHVSLLCVLYFLIGTFRYYLDKSGKISSELNHNSYNVYIIHVVVMGGVALGLLYTTIPSLLKFFVLIIATYAVCNLIVSFYRRAIKARI